MAQLDQIFEQLGDAGQRMTAIDAAEGAAGNISVFMREMPNFPAAFAKQCVLTLPESVPALIGGWLLVSVSGSRLRDFGSDPNGTLCLLHVQDDTAAVLYASQAVRPTSELNSHLLIHDAYVRLHDAAMHTVVHVQPPYLTYLSHVLPPDSRAFSKRLLRWQPETIMTFPEGIGVLPFQVPGSHAQAVATAEAMHTYRAVVWARHGIVVRDRDVRHAADLIEYAEAAARYEYLNLQAGERSSGLSEDQIRRMCHALGIEQRVF